MKKLLSMLVIAAILGGAAVSLWNRAPDKAAEPLPDTKVERATQSPEIELAELALRQIFLDNGSGSNGSDLKRFNACYVSIDVTKYNDEIDHYMDRSRHFPHTPPPGFMEGLRDLNLPLVPAQPGNSLIISTAPTRPENIIVFYIDGIIRLGPDRVKVMSGYYVHPLNAGKYECTFKLSNGKWQMEEHKCIGIS